MVHQAHGVGRYLGLETLEAGGQANEFLALSYADGAKLYVPVDSLHLISRYSGADDELAPLHKLGSDQWEKARRKAAEKFATPPQSYWIFTPAVKPSKARYTTHRGMSTFAFQPASHLRKHPTSKPPLRR